MSQYVHVLFVASFVLFGCNKPDRMTINTEKASDIFIDITLADQIINLHSPEDRDSIREVLTQSLLKVHNITQAELDTNMYLYMSDFEKYGDLTDLMLSKYDSLLINENK